jgi:hypothetical protein
MSINDSIKEAMVGLLVRYGKAATEVTSWEDRTEYGGYCETCSYEYVVVDINYVEAVTGKRQTYTYDGTFATLIWELEND